MKQFIKVVLGLCLSIALITPLAFISERWYLSAFIALVSASSYIFNYFKTKRILFAFLAAMLFGAFFSISFWLLYHIDFILHLKYELFFIGSFFTIFSIVSWIIILLKESRAKKTFFFFLSLGSAILFTFLVIYIKDMQDSAGLAILLGSLIGGCVAVISTYLFHYFIKKTSKIFNSLTDYIAILLKPFLIFFAGYLLIALLYAGFYNLILELNPTAFHIPEGQVAFLDLFIFALDTMTTGGNSAVTAEATFVQALNTLNVFTAIVWMTVMLAATIAYTSESFSEVFRKHNKNKTYPTHLNTLSNLP